MKDKKLQIFVSSTYTDLKEERQAAVEAILSSGNIPAEREIFKVLERYRLVKQDDHYNGSLLTDDGHRFYLKFLADKQNVN